jgi:3-methyladenine DNA glycosylase AlkD
VNDARIATQANDVERQLRAAGTPERAIQEKRYLKSDLEFAGAGVPAIRRIARDLLKENPKDNRYWLLAMVEALWSRPVHELRLTAVILLTCEDRLLALGDMLLLERLLRDSRTWALVDDIAGDVVGKLVLRYPEVMQTLDRWAIDPDFWIRRSALLAFLLPIKGDPAYFERFARYAGAMLHEQEFFIRKAIGWVLRESGKKQPDLVYAWLLPRAACASGVTVREAVKYLPSAQHDAILKARGAGRKA